MASAVNLLHPITLEHVLKAIGDKRIRIDPSFDGAVGFEIYREKVGWVRTSYAWFLTKPIAKQSPETIEWLNEVINPR